MWAGDLILYGGLAILAHSLVGLVAIWVGLGSGRWFLRVAALGGLLALGLAVPAYDLVLGFLIQSVLVIVPLWLIGGRALSIRLGRSDRSPRVRWQFSLLDLLLAAVVVAAITALVASVPTDAWEMWGYCGLPAAVFSAVSTLAAAWVGLGRRFLCLRLVLLLLITISGLVGTWLNFGGGLDILRLVPFLLLPSSVVMACWLALLRASGYRWSGKRQAASFAATTTGPSRRRALITRLAGAALVLLSLLILAPLGFVYYLLINPVPIPDTTAPSANGYDTLAETGEFLDGVGVPDAETATKKQLRAFVTQHGQVLDKARDALDLPCQVPLEYSLSDMWRASSSTLPLCRAFLAEGKLAEMEGRTGEAVETYLDLIRLGQATARAGLLGEAHFGWVIEEEGGKALYGLRQRLAPEQCGQLIGDLVSLEARREPVDDLLLRERAWWHNVCGWWGRLYQIKSDLFSLMSVSIRNNARRQQAKASLLICELGIRIYQSEHASPPEKLADLVPDYLPAEPQDPFGKGALVYRRTSSGYVLYSVGRDGLDDGGRPYEWSPSEGLLGGDLLLEEPPDAE
jgi:hypothetical protein